MNKRKREEIISEFISKKREWVSELQRREWMLNNIPIRCNWCTLKVARRYEYIIYYNHYYPTSVVTKKLQLHAHYLDDKDMRTIGTDPITKRYLDLLTICNICMDNYRELIDKVYHTIEQRWQAIKSDVSFKFK